MLEIFAQVLITVVVSVMAASGMAVIVLALYVLFKINEYYLYKILYPLMGIAGIVGYILADTSVFYTISRIISGAITIPLFIYIMLIPLLEGIPRNCLKVSKIPGIIWKLFPKFMKKWVISNVLNENKASGSDEE